MLGRLKTILIYPFIAPTLSPLTKYFWKNGKTTIIGPAATMHMAIRAVRDGTWVLSIHMYCRASAELRNSRFFKTRINSVCSFNRELSDVYIKLRNQSFQY